MYIFYSITSEKYWKAPKNIQETMAKKNVKGGKKGRRGKNDNESQKRELIYKDEGQEYAQITKMLGNSRVSANCFDGVVRIAHIRGNLRKKAWMSQGDIILVSLRDFQDDQCDVLHKYNLDEARTLKQQGELPENAKIYETDNFGFEDDEDVNFEFGAEDEEEEDDDDEEFDIDDI